MEYNKLLKYLRNELNVKQIDMYSGVTSKSSYKKIESGEKQATIEELIAFSNKLGIRFSEFLARADLTKLDTSFFGKQKSEIVSSASDFSILKNKFDQIYSLRLTNLQYYSLFIIAIAIANSLGKELYQFSPKDVKELKQLYSKRHHFLGIDYEIFANLFFVTEPTNFDFLYEKLFPVNKSQGEVHDNAVQLAVKNAISVFLERKEFKSALMYFEEFNNLKTLNNFVINGYTNLEILYLRHLFNFLNDRNIEEYLKAINIVNLFNDLGEYDIRDSLAKEVSEIAKKENFEVPDSVSLITDKFDTKRSKLS
ncbi:helix-turn-helix domain-containing protein [Enterococcus plantarum]|uniref:helix-turn-helix domain-containing protein n=1 Tax=Enterococcus plantarum TaxID=1077675 RepID=UPI001A8ECE46|nr:helix-turn-helix transcriptional regulator [Enterococcus plantarum]